MICGVTFLVSAMAWVISSISKSERYFITWPEGDHDDGEPLLDRDLFIQPFVVDLAAHEFLHRPSPTSLQTILSISVYRPLPKILAAFPLSEIAIYPIALLLNLKGGDPFGILQPAIEFAQKRQEQS